MRTKKIILSVLAAMFFGVIGLLFSFDFSFAVNYPTKPIQVVVPYAPGGGSDLVIRIVTERLKEFIGQPVVVVNKPGGGAVLGAFFVAKAKPDGHTLLGCTQSSVILSPITKGDIEYKPEDFEPICHFQRKERCTLEDAE